MKTSPQPPAARRLVLPLATGATAGATAGAAALLWLAWPWLRPQVWPAPGPRWLVVLDGYHRLDHALDRQRRSREAILLLTCPSSGQPSAEQLSRHWLQQPSAPLLVLQEGFDTATQAAALARWLQRRQQQGLPAPRQLLLVSDPHHFPRASLAAQIAVGSAGVRVLPLPVPTAAGAAGLPRDWSSWRDAVRLQLWRLSGSTGAFLQPAAMERKLRACQPERQRS